MCSLSNVRKERELLDYAMWGAPAPTSPEKDCNIKTTLVC